MMERYEVTGMSCAACSARVEKVVSGLAGVTSCSVNLLTNSMTVEGEVSPETVMQAVARAGYGARPVRPGTGAGTGARSTGAGAPGDEGELKDRETGKLMRRLLASLVFLLILMYFSMGHRMLGLPIPAFFRENYIAQGLLQMLLAAAVMVINGRFFVNGVRGLLHRAPNMDTLVAMGSAASFLYSTVLLFAMTGAQLRGDGQQVMAWAHDLYFESAAMILTLITVGKLLESRSKGRTTDALKELMLLVPRVAVVDRGGEQTVPVEQVRPGDIFLVRSGDSIPVDGVVLEGRAALDESAMTGESLPVDKKEGDSVTAGTLNRSGFLRCRAERVGEDTALSGIIRMVSEGAAAKAPIARLADRVSGVFVPAVLALAVLTLLIWMAVGESVGFSLARAISVLVISCPCALGLATPVAIMVGSGVGAGHGILFKTAASLEETGKVDIVVLDKTGTVTRGEPSVLSILPAPEIREEELLELAVRLEVGSEHPLAGAILREGSRKGLAIPSSGLQDFRVLPGQGLSALWEGRLLRGGSLEYISSLVPISPELRRRAEEMAETGATPMVFALGEKPLGIIAVADSLKEESPGAVKELQNMGIRVVLLTGDNERTAETVARAIGADEVIAGVLPRGKEEVIRLLQERGRVAMVGDGINDAPALTRADIGIAIGAGTEVAVDAAQVVLMKSRLTDVPAAIRLSRATLKNIRENLFWAFFYNIIGIPLAAGLWIPLLGLRLNPMVGAAAMSLSSFCVVSNALRLNRCRLFDPAGDRRKKETADISAVRERYKEEHKMKLTMKIEGMMCGHCEARVKKTLEKIPQVERAEVSHTAGTALVTLREAVDPMVLKAAVEEQDYPVTEIRE